MRSWVLDTHACVFMLAAPRKLGAAARAAIESIESGRGQGYVPAAVVAEIILLRGLARTDVGLPDVRRALKSCPRLRFLPLELEQLDEFAALVSIRDPFDRLIVAAARTQRAVLITRDGPIAESALCETAWD